MALGLCRLALHRVSHLCAATITCTIFAAAPATAQPRAADTPKAEGEKKNGEADKAAPATSTLSILRSELPPIGLAECLRIANERQPAIAAARATLAAREAAHAGITALSPPLPKITAPDLPVRRVQSLRGISAAQADVCQAEFDTAYAVIRMYYTAVYAQQQYSVADGVVRRTEDKKALVDKYRESGDSVVGPEVSDRIGVIAKLARNKRTDAAAGFDRALAGLREAMGLGLDCTCHRPIDLELPLLAVVPCREQLIELALQRRGEIIQAIVAADVSRLEVDAQGRFCFKSLVRTFASSSDIHAKALPTALHNGQYRPGAVGIEFPGNLAGQKPYRMAQASAYADRMGAVVEKTRGLVTLEVEDNFLKWRESSEKVRDSREAADAGRKLAIYSDEQSKQPKENKVTERDAVENFVLAGQAQAALNEAVFEQILALANLERITAGGFCAGFLTTPTATAAPVPTITSSPAALPEPKVPSFDAKKD